MRRRFDDMVSALRRVTVSAQNLERVGRQCEGCERPECALGCAYAPKRKDEPVTRIVERIPSSIHEPIERFSAPPPRPTIAEVYRTAGQEIVAAIEHMVRTCEEARVEGLKLVEALYEHGDWHDEFLASYVTVQTQAAGVMRDAWKKQIEDLRNKQLALTQQVAPAPATTTEGGKS